MYNGVVKTYNKLVLTNDIEYITDRLNGILESYLVKLTDIEEIFSNWNCPAADCSECFNDNCIIDKLETDRQETEETLYFIENRLEDVKEGIIEQW